MADVDAKENMNHPTPHNESDRVKALKRYNLLDTAPEASYDDFTFLVFAICEVPIALISLVDETRQWFKSKTGLAESETPRDHAFCAHAILDNKTMMVADAATDPRFADNPLVTGNPNIRFYAGAPLVTPDGYGIGTLCAIDRKPRVLSAQQTRALEALARQLMTHLEMRRVSASLAEALHKIKAMDGLIPICCYCKSIRKDTGFWTTLEEYIADHSVADLTHGICPACMEKHFPEPVDAEKPKSA